MPAQVLVLGIAQDGGLPQAGCACANCASAWQGGIPPASACSIAIIDPQEQAAWMIDASPDFPSQLHLLKETAPGVELRGLFLTHAHMGHYAGLVHLGREAMNTRGLPVHATEACLRFLRANGPWSQLLRLGNIAPVVLSPGAPVRLTANVTVEAVAVPHRAEFSDTVAYRIEGAARSIFYCPDIDRWDAWDRDAREFIGRHDIALLDGTFFRAGEPAHRNPAEIPHPPVEETAGLLRGLSTGIRYLHLNHSNPLHADSPERRWLRAQGQDVARVGESWEL